MAKYYTENVVLNYLNETPENVRITTVDPTHEYPDYIVTYFDKISGNPEAIEFITACYVGLSVGYKFNKYRKKIPKTKKEYILNIGRKKLLLFDEWAILIDDVKRCESYWS